jgi:hypothetical protein
MYVETEGDAVGQPDTPLQPVSVVTGRVGYSLPFLGFLMYMLTIPSGVLSIFSLALTMLLCIWLLGNFERHEDHHPENEYECELARTLDALQMREMVR